MSQEFAQKEMKAEDMKYNPWVLWLNKQYRKVHKEKWNILSCVVGLPRTGKSVFATSMCKLLNPDFDINNDVVYTEKQFRRRIENIDSIGETIVWDEAGVGMSARDWYKIQNKEIGKMLQTMGHLRPIIWFVTPDASYIDSQARKLFHFFFEARNRTNNYTYIRPFNIKVDKRSGKVLYMYPRLVKNGLHRMTGLRFYKPPKDFIDEYDQHSNPQKMQLRENQSNLIDKGGKDSKKKAHKDSIQSIQNEILDNPDTYLNKRGNFDRDIIYLHYKDQLKEAGSAKTQASAIAKVCDKKYAKRKNPVEDE